MTKQIMTTTNTLYFKGSKHRNEIAIPDFANGRFLTDDRQIELYCELRVRGYAQFDSFASAFGDELGGHPDDLAAAAEAFEQSAVYDECRKRVTAKYTREEAEGFWQQIAYAARGRCSAARSAIEHSADVSCADAEAAASREAYFAHRAATQAAADRKAAALEQRNKNVSSGGGFTFL
jgi:hypothetical protein